MGRNPQRYNLVLFFGLLHSSILLEVPDEVITVNYVDVLLMVQHVKPLNILRYHIVIGLI